MYTVSKGPSKIVAKSRRGLSQNYEKFETIKESGKKSNDLNSPEKNNGPRPVFQSVKKSPTQVKPVEETVITPAHEEIIQYITDSWNIIVAQNPYDARLAENVDVSPSLAVHADAHNHNNNHNHSSGEFDMPSSPAADVLVSGASSASTNGLQQQQTPPITCYCIEPPSPALNDFKPFDLESWWGRRLFNNITKSL